MLKWRGRIAIIECESCDEVIESEPGESFDEFTARRKKAGWTAQRVRNGRIGEAADYTHGCPLHKA